MKLYDHIELAGKYGDGKGLIAESDLPKAPDKAAFALGVAKRLSEAKQPETKPSQLATFPVAN